MADYRQWLEDRVARPSAATPAAQVPGAFAGPGDTFRGTSPVVQGPPVERALSRAFLEVHRHDGRRYELTPWCKSASWTPSVNEPWTTIEFTLVLPWANRNLAPVIGDWVVLRSLSGTPYAWGVITQEPAPGIEGGVGSAGSIASAGITFRAVSWLRYLREAQIFASPYAIAGRPTSIGTYFSGEDWVARVESLMNELVRGTLGTALVQAATSMMRIQLPPTLGGGMLGDAVQVVFDNESALVAQLQRYRCDPVRGPRIMSAASCFPETTNVLDYLLGIFVPDRRLVEFFETLAPLRQESQATRDALGAVPTLVYRIAPFRTQSLGSFMSANANVPAPTQSGGDDPGQSLEDPDAALVAEYTAPTWVPSLGNVLDYDRDFVNFPTPTRSDAERVNAVTLGLPTQSDSPIRFWKEAGLPFANWDSVARFGFRLYQPNWPYFPPVPTTPTANTTLGSAAQQGARQAVAGAAGSGSGDGTTLVGYIRTIAGLAAMMFLGVERYWRGRIIVGQGDQTIRVGLPTTLGWPGGVRFTAYADSIQHNVDFGGPQGQCRGTSAVQYSRGAWSSPEERDAPERVPVAIDTTPPTPAVKTPAPAAVSQPSNGQRVANQPVLFAGRDIPWVSPFSLDRWLLTKPLGNRVRRTQAGITQAVLHYTDGNVNSLTANGTYATFNVLPTSAIAAASNGVLLPQATINVTTTRHFASRGAFTIAIDGTNFTINYTGKTDTTFTGCSGGSGRVYTGNAITQPGVDSHFIIEADGGVVQIMDLAITAYQAGVSIVNRKSIGIDFVNPELINRTTAQAPWQYKTGFTLVPSPNTTSRSFYAPTALQIASCRALIIWANNNLGIPLTAPAATGDVKTVRYYQGNWPAGVYHHAEVFKGRQDCLGIYIPTDILGEPAP